MEEGDGWLRKWDTKHPDIHTERKRFAVIEFTCASCASLEQVSPTKLRSDAENVVPHSKENSNQTSTSTPKKKRNDAQLEVQADTRTRHTGKTTMSFHSSMHDGKCSNRVTLKIRKGNLICG